MFDEESVNYGAIHTNYSSRPGAGSQWFPRSQALIALISNTSSVEARGATLCVVWGGKFSAPAVTFSPKPRRDRQARAPSYRLLGLALVRGISTTTYDHTSSQDPCPAVSPNDALLPRSLHNGPSLLPQLSLLQSALRVGIAPHPHSTLPRPNVHRPRCLWPR